MDVALSTSTPHVPSEGGLTSQLLLLQFLNQLCTHQKNTTQYTEEEVQHCIASVKQEENRRKQLLKQQEEEYSKLSVDYLNLQDMYLSAGKQIGDMVEFMKESSKKYEEKISALEKEISARMVCERDAKLQNVLEQMNKELHEMRSSGLSDDRKINQTLETLQQISQNQTIAQDINTLKNQLSIANETIQNYTEVHAKQSKELENERRKTEMLAQNAQLENSLLNLHKQQHEQIQEFEAKLLTKAEELRNKDQELRKKDDELTSERIKNTELHSILVQIYKQQSLHDGSKILEKYIYILLSLANEFIQNSTEIYTRQTRELEIERRKTRTIEEQNGQLQTFLGNLQKQQNQSFETALQEVAQELKHKYQEIKNKDEELRNKDQELKKKDNELNDERKKNVELQKMFDEMQKKGRDAEIENTEVLKAERNNCSSELQKQKTLSESKLKLEENKTQEAQSELSICEQHLVEAKRQTFAYVTKVIEFTNQYRKYLATANLNFAIAVYGDPEIKDIFRLSGGIIGERMTTEEAHQEGFSCGNDRYIPKCFKCDGTDDCGNRNDELNCSSSLFPPGARVVRGADWDWGNQDGNPPGVGTVTEEMEAYKGSVEVKWDNDKRGVTYYYRTGARGYMDLRVAAGYFCGAT